MAGLLFVFVDHGAGIRRATYLCLDCAKNVDKNWNITVSFIIHVNFDHAWVEHYPVTLRPLHTACTSGANYNVHCIIESVDSISRNGLDMGLGGGGGGGGFGG